MSHLFQLVSAAAGSRSLMRASPPLIYPGPRGLTRKKEREWAKNRDRTKQFKHWLIHSEIATRKGKINQSFFSVNLLLLFISITTVTTNYHYTFSVALFSQQKYYETTFFHPIIYMDKKNHTRVLVCKKKSFMHVSVIYVSLYILYTIIHLIII